VGTALVLAHGSAFVLALVLLWRRDNRNRRLADVFESRREAAVRTA
jgi:hypothetical protein